MLDIISEAPTYVWFILALILWRGWKATRTHIISWRFLIIVPIAVLIWTTYPMIKNYQPLLVLLWIISLGIGLLIIRKISLRFDKKKNIIEFPGNWLPMIFLLAIFVLRFYQEATSSIHPELIGSIKLLTAQYLATAISAIFLGRLIGVWQRSKRSPHVDLATK